MRKVGVELDSCFMLLQLIGAHTMLRRVTSIDVTMHCWLLDLDKKGNRNSATVAERRKTDSLDKGPPEQRSFSLWN